MMNRQEIIDALKVRQEMLRRNARDNPVDYVEYVHRFRWIRGRHLEFAINEIEKFLDGKVYDERGEEAEALIVTMPPQHGKSQSITESLPSYLASKNPYLKVIIVAYNEDLAHRFNRRNREKVREFGKDLFDVDSQRDNATEIELSNGSTIRAVGFMAGITGHPADVIFIDDPIKNRQEADSETFRDAMWVEFRESIRTRLSANGKIVIILTRWHKDDLAGRIERFDELPSVTINLPCEAQEDDPLGREVGESLFPEIGKDNNWLKRFKRSYMSDPEGGSRSWNALFQGSPSEEEGNIFRRESWGWYKKTPEFVGTLPVLILSVDAAFKGTKSSDKVSLQVWGKKGADVYFVDNVTDNMTFKGTLTAIRALLAKYPTIGARYVEDKANGTAIIEQLNAEFGGFIPVKADVSTGGKVARAYAVEPFVASGNVYLPEGEVWVSDFVDEAAEFPRGAFKDQVDAMTQALNKLIFFYAEVQSVAQTLYESFFGKKEEPDGEYPVMELELVDDFTSYGM